MKRYLVLITLFLSSLPGFGSNRQPSRSSQFHINKSHTSGKAVSDKADRAKRNAAVHARDGMKRPPVPMQARTNTAHKGSFAARPFGVKSNSSSATVNFIAGARTAWAGTDDDETESVMGDFNGDGNMDVAKVTFVEGEGPAYQISVLLGNGDGTFQTAIVTPTPSNADDTILVGDVNGDGNDDIIQIHPQGDNCDVAQKAGAKARVAQACKTANNTSVRIIDRCSDQQRRRHLRRSSELSGGVQLTAGRPADRRRRRRQAGRAGLRQCLTPANASGVAGRWQRSVPAAATIRQR